MSPEWVASLPMSLRLAPGDLLAAHPGLDDPNFVQSVILICEHTAEGAFGLVLNRPTGVTLDQLMPAHPTLADSEQEVRLGGPVDHTRLHFVHCVPGRVSGGTLLRPGLWFGGDVDELGTYLAEQRQSDNATNDAADHVRVFVGYTGWGEGQLDAELESGSWIPALGRDEWIFCAPGDGAWRGVIDAMLGSGDGEPPAPHQLN